MGGLGTRCLYRAALQVLRTWSHNEETGAAGGIPSSGLHPLLVDLDPNCWHRRLTVAIVLLLLLLLLTGVSGPIAFDKNGDVVPHNRTYMWVKHNTATGVPVVKGYIARAE